MNMGGQLYCGRPHRKLEPTDVILSSSNANNLVYFLPEFACLLTKSNMAAVGHTGKVPSLFLTLFSRVIPYNVNDFDM